VSQLSARCHSKYDWERSHPNGWENDYSMETEGV